MQWMLVYIILLCGFVCVCGPCGSDFACVRFCVRVFVVCLCVYVFVLCVCMWDGGCVCIHACV